MLNNSHASDQSGNSVELDVNLEALQESAVSVFHEQCTSIQKLSEGGFHKVYILKMKNDKEYIGRVAFPVYPRWKTESEVAVMEYIRLNTTIPIPKVYYWNSSVNNPVRAEYIFMERLSSSRLCDIWPGLSINKKEMFLLKIIEILLALKKLTFSKVIEIDLFSDERATLSTMEKGPFNTTKEYILAVIRNKIRYYETFKSIDQQEYWIPRYQELCKLVPKYFQDDENKFVLTHGDFHSSNILVNNDEITGIIDWECSGAFPMECLCTYPVWITDNPMMEPTNEEFKENLTLQKFFRDNIIHRDPDFKRIIDNINEKKDEFYSAVFNQEEWKINDSLDELGINNMFTF
ncbi:8228_t:CDS:2 [Scutellospora calospora]|uniref:8228_t:CDS:1 n=1 Tax=Scutellospora calospora TaxID=85575 RepID=A0ACA9JVJ5_9GLOM|nr:8228_t:CDS:2 [Scutellospora calospora]